MDIGYEWKPAEKRKPKAYDVVKFKSSKDEDKEYLAIWTGDEYYIFDVYSGRWKTLENAMLRKNGKELELQLTGFVYAYIPKDQTQYLPYWALANTRKGDMLR